MGTTDYSEPTARPAKKAATLSVADLDMHDYFAAHAPITTEDAMLACGVTAASVGTLRRNQRIAVMTKLADMRSDYADAMLERRAT